MMRRLGLAAALVAVALGPLAGCVTEGQDRRTGPPAEVLKQQDPPEVQASQLAAIKPGKQLPLRDGEQRMTVKMAAAYTPSAPTGVGTDDYRCFLLDPKLKKDVFLTGNQVLPGNPQVVHHVILFRVDPEQVGEAKALDAETQDPGWTCFGGTGLKGEFANVDDANWLAAWAPGGDETMTRDGYGTPLRAGSQIVMQVHYNLLQGAAPDVSSTQLRWMSGDAGLTPLHTYQLPAPVELPCRPDHSGSPLCNRFNAEADIRARFGEDQNTHNLLHLLCDSPIEAVQTTSCVRNVNRGMTILGVAGHMHLLGRKISIETNPGTPEARTILDVPIWDFDNQGSRPLKEPLHLDAGDTVKVTCTHVQWLRDVLPAFEEQREDRYILWAEGSTDEMCLGSLSVAFDDES
ncbi:hypothetical protein [Nocardioides caricicola]|uniref:Copper type II ascorbate-dependent monooxygenase C-terminal domain-containing protein n=1 Tax=Nocardioides caricicola TaxID=634770 RepID=A0ABW0N5P0_9ACTN